MAYQSKKDTLVFIKEEKTPHPTGTPLKKRGSRNVNFTQYFPSSGRVTERLGGKYSVEVFVERRGKFISTFCREITW